MKKAFTLLFLFIIAVAFIASERHDSNPDQINPPNVYPLTVDSKQMNANTINTWFRNNGSYNRDPSTGNAGFEWPKGSGKTARYASGLWLGAVVDGDTLIAMAEYSYDYLPGYTDADGNPQGKDDPVYKVYKITRNLNDADRQNWPNALLGNSNQNAPVYFDQGSGQYKPLDLGYQTLYYVYTDSYPEGHVATGGGTAPLKADIQQTNFAFNFGGALGQIAFTQLRIINRSTKAWNQAYLGAWTDDDLGESGDDMVACDTVLGLGYTYNGDNNDGIYGAAPPAVGFDFFRGAIIEGAPTDFAVVCNGNVKDTLWGKKQLGLNVFNWYRNTTPPPWTDPLVYYETYRILEGKGKYGQPIIHPNGDTTHFFYSGDPVTGTGWITGPMAPDDQRFMQSTGPFLMNPGDTQIIVVGQVIGRGSSNLNSITVLRAYDLKAQLIYNNCFNVPAPPPPPAITTYAPGNGKIYLSWDDVAERTREYNLYNGSYYNFEGYNVYAIRTGTDGSDPADRLLLATFDVNNGIKDIWDSVEVPQYGAIIWGVVQKGSDNGIQRTIIISKDPFSGRNLVNGTPYCFSVTAYSYDSLSGFSVGTPKFNESSVSANVRCVTPQRLAQGTVVNYDFGDTLNTNRKDLAVQPTVVDPLAITENASYMLKYTAINSTLAYELYKNGNLIRTSFDFSGNADTATVIDGVMILNGRNTDSGIVKDITDPEALIRDINSRDKGWEYYPPENRWVMGPDTNKIRTASSQTVPFFKGRQFQSRSMGMSWPYSGGTATTSNFRNLKSRIVANGTTFTEVPNSGGVFTGGPLRKIRIIFGQTSKAYRYANNDGNVLDGDTNRLSNPGTPYKNFVDIPFSVFEYDELSGTGTEQTKRQLNVAFIDADDNGQWDPDTTAMGKYQITYVLASTYSASEIAYYTTKNPGLSSPSLGFPSFDIMYAWVPRVMLSPTGAPLTWTQGDKLDVWPYTPTRLEFVPGSPVFYTWSVEASQFGNTGYAVANNQMDKVNVFPNPYFGQNPLETNPVDRFVTFTNLPSSCTIYIYSLNGLLIRKLDRFNGDPKNSSERWNLRNDSDIPVASGMYLVVIEAQGIGNKIVKLAVFTPEERIDTY